MRRCPRFGDEGVDSIHANDDSVWYGPCEVHVMCEFFSGASQMTIKSNMVVIDVAMDNKSRAASLKPATATFMMLLENIVELRNFANEASAPEDEAELDSGLLVLLDTGQACAIEGVSDDMCLKALHSAWQTQLLRLAVRIPKCRDSDIDAATVAAYYAAVVQGIRDPPSVDSLVELLQEFSREVLCNTVLKRLVFDTNEILTCLVQLWTALLDKQSFYQPRLAEDIQWKRLLPQERARRSTLYSQLRNPVDRSVDLHSLQDDFNQYLLSIVAARMRLLGHVSQTLSAIFFGSELIPTRAEAVTSDDASSPLGLLSWLRLAMTDPLHSLCEAVGLDPAATHSLAREMADAPMAPEDSAKWPRQGGWGSPVKVVPSLAVESPSESRPNGLRVDPDAIAQIPQLVADIQGRQSLLVFEVFRVVSSQRAVLLSASRHALPSLLVNFQHRSSLSTQRTRMAVRRGASLLSARQQAQVAGAHKLASVSATLSQLSTWPAGLARWASLLLDELHGFLVHAHVRLVRGGAVSMASRGSRSSFASRGSLPSWPSPVYDGREDRIARGLALVFYLAHAAHFLAVDAADVRRVLRCETLSHWRSIASILRLLAPLRGEGDEEGEGEGEGRAYTAGVHSPREGRGGAEKGVAGTLSSLLTASWQFFRPTPVSSPVPRPVPSPVPGPVPGPASAGLAPHLSSRSLASAASARSGRSLASRAGSAWDLPAAPRHGLSRAQWRLLLLARLRVEALLFDVLGLHPRDVYAEARPDLLPVHPDPGGEDDNLLDSPRPWRPAGEDGASSLEVGERQGQASSPGEGRGEGELRPKPSSFDPLDTAPPPTSLEAEGKASASSRGEGGDGSVSPRGILASKTSSRRMGEGSARAGLLGEDSFAGDVSLLSPEARAKKRVRLSV